MSYEIARPSIRPLPPTPAARTAEASSSPSHRSPPPRDSLITVASTILPEYSFVSGHETAIAWDEDDGSLTPIPQPPRYSCVLPNGTQSVPHAPAPGMRESHDSSGPLTPYRGRPGFIERKLHLMKGSENPWATLKLISRGPLPNSQSRSLRFIGGDFVRGVLELNLDSPMNVQSLTLNLKCRVTTIHEESSFIDGTEEDSIILDYRHILYSKGTHVNPGSFGECSTSRERKPDGKMHGTYHIPFIFAFPTTSAIGAGRNGTSTATYNLPPSFSERHSEIRTRYDLTLTVKHGFLKRDSKTSIDIVYMPKIVAPPISVARSTAYESGIAFPGPRDDPDGWHGSPSASWSGKFLDREAHISCNLWLAKPLCYTRGTVIPCYLALLGFDLELLEHLSSPQTVQVQLTRHIYFGEDTMLTSNKPHEERRKETCNVGTAIWWKSPDSGQLEDRNSRWLEGEIHLPQGLHPSCHHPHFSIEYYVEMMPFLSSEFITCYSPTILLGDMPSTFQKGDPHGCTQIYLTLEITRLPPPWPKGRPPSLGVLPPPKKVTTKIGRIDFTHSPNTSPKVVLAELTSVEELVYRTRKL